jgi:hypothetical protein
MPTDPRVLTLARTLGMGKRETLGLVVESWAWLVAQANDHVINGMPDVLDAVVDVEGVGQGMVAVGLVTLDGENMMLPPELRRPAAGGRQTSPAAADDQGDVRKRRQAAERQSRLRKRQRLGKPAPARANKPDAADKPDQPNRRPRKLGKACGHVVMLLYGRHGAFVELNDAQPKLTASAEGYDYDTLTLADAVELLVPRHKAHTPPGGGYRVPKLADLEVAAKQERERQTVADMEPDRRAEANSALMEAATDAADADVEPTVERDSHAPVTHVTRDGVTRHASRNAATSPKSSGDSGLDAADRHATRHAPALSSSSLSLSSSCPVDAQRETTTTKAIERDGQRDVSNAHEALRTTEGDGRPNGQTGSDRPVGRMPEARGVSAREPLQPWQENDRQARRRMLADLYADGLDMMPDDVLRLWNGSKPEQRRLFDMLQTAGIDPATGRHRSGSVAQAAGIPLPRVGLNDPRVVGAADQGDRQGRDDQGVDQGDGRGHNAVRGDVEQLLDAKAG